MSAPEPMRAAGADERVRQSRGHQRRQRIINEAVALLSDKGFRGASIAELADRVGMTHPGLLYYFGSKERLLHEVVAERERMENAAVYGSLTNEDASLARLPEIGRMIFGSMQFTRLYVVLAAENLDEADPLHEFFVDRYARAREKVQWAVRSDIAGGRVRADADADQISVEVVATLMGLEMQYLMDPGRIDYLAAVDAYTAGLIARLVPAERSERVNTPEL